MNENENFNGRNIDRCFDADIEKLRRWCKFRDLYLEWLIDCQMTEKTVAGCFFSWLLSKSRKLYMLKFVKTIRMFFRRNNSELRCKKWERCRLREASEQSYLPGMPCLEKKKHQNRQFQPLLSQIWTICTRHWTEGWSRAFPFKSDVKVWIVQPESGLVKRRSRLQLCVFFLDKHVYGLEHLINFSNPQNCSNFHCFSDSNFRRFMIFQECHMRENLSGWEV